MKYLFLNTACKNAEVLLICGNEVYLERVGERAQATENLLPCIDRLFEKADITIKDIDAFSCVSGPGSFTGIRVGITTIRAFAYAYDKPCIDINYFDILARNADSSAEVTVLLADGGNKMKYMTVRDNFGATLLPAQYVDEVTLKKFLSEIEEPFCIVSDCVLDGYKVILRSEDGADFIKAAKAKIKGGKEITYNELNPLYIAKSQAERDKGL